MNKRKGDFHRWIIDEWTKVNCPSVVCLGLGGASNYMRLWEHKYGKMYIVYDTTYERRS
jgi:hypothetical protein